MSKEKRSIFRIAAALLCVFALVLPLGSCSKPEVELGYQSPYDWSRLIYTEGRYSYWKEGDLASRTGIDVSDHQGFIDWQAVADDRIDFVIVRLGNRGYTEGGLYLDDHFERNLEGARAAGLFVGVYFFSQAINEQEALEEADFVLNALHGRNLDYPVIYDFEPVNDSRGRANNLSPSQLTRNARVFCDRIEAEGYTAMIYGNKGDIGRLYLKALKEFDIWFAEYGVSRPSGQFDFIIWQYTSSASVNGVPTRVDMNIHFLEP